MGYPNRSIRAEGDPARVTDEQRRRIADRALEIAVEYHGKPTSITSTHARFGAKGSLKVNFASKHAGTWVDWEAGTKGDRVAHLMPDGPSVFVAPTAMYPYTL